MRYDTIVIAGTSESREVIKEQLKEGHQVLACVATDLGAQMLEEYQIDVHIGLREPAEVFNTICLEQVNDTLIIIVHANDVVPERRYKDLLISCLCVKL